MRALITGGAGFIGSHLAEELLRRGKEVLIIDDLSTGSIENIEHLRGHVGFRYVVDTVMNRPLLAESVDQCDTIFHLAAAVGVRLIVESPVRTIETNVRATELVLELAAKKRKKVLITSTSEVYGKSQSLPFREQDDLLIGPPDKGRWSYACSKAIDEFLALAYWREKKLPTIIVRLFNTIGPRQTGHYGMVAPTFIRQALAGEPVTVFGDGTQSRCFGWVGDVVDALIALTEHPDAVGKVFNIGHNQEVTIRELAERVISLTHSRSSIRMIPYDQAYESGFEDMHRRIPSLERIQKLIGYKPTKTLDQILEAIIRSQSEKASRRPSLVPQPTARLAD
ncbi:MAG: NAD-dependent epimerase/dehydratase family protein [Candidatus Acidiferrales bacterium]